MTNTVNSESDHSNNIKPRRLRWLFGILAAVGILLVSLIAAIQWWMVTNDFGSVVERVGGKFYRTETQPLLQRTLNRINGSTTVHRIHFAPGQVNDAWMLQHTEKLHSLSHLSLTLNGTEVTDAGLQALQGCCQIHELNLQESRLTKASSPVFDSMPGLVSLNIAHTDLKAADLSPRCLSRLMFLSVDGSQIDDPGIEILKSVFGKSGIAFRDFRLYDADKESLQRLEQLQFNFSLRLAGKPVHSDCIPALVQLVRSNGLKQLSIDDSNFTREESSQLRNAIGGCLLQQISQDDYDRMEERSVPVSAKGLW